MHLLDVLLLLKQMILSLQGDKEVAAQTHAVTHTYLTKLQKYRETGYATFFYLNFEKVQNVKGHTSGTYQKKSPFKIVLPYVRLAI